MSREGFTEIIFLEEISYKDKADKMLQIQNVTFKAKMIERLIKSLDSVKEDQKVCHESPESEVLKEEVDEINLKEAIDRYGHMKVDLSTCEDDFE